MTVDANNFTKQVDYNDLADTVNPVLEQRIQSNKQKMKDIILDSDNYKQINNNKKNIHRLALNKKANNEYYKLVEENKKLEAAKFIKETPEAVDFTSNIVEAMGQEEFEAQIQRWYNNETFITNGTTKE